MSTKILVVDDEPDLEELLEQRFRTKIETNTYELRFASNGRAALSLIEEEPDFDVLLLDINMPEMDGLTLLSKIPDLLPHSRAVIVSAYSDMDNIRLAMNRGAFDFVGKPINLKDLEITIEKTSEHVRQLRESARIKQLADLKARFFDNITHDFRTPLALILAPLEQLIREYNHPDALNRHLLTIDYNARHMLRLINQLLELAKLEAGHLQVDLQAGELGKFIAQIVETFTPFAQQKGVSINYRNEATGHWLFDAQKVGQIAYNIIGNALKFSSPSSSNAATTAGLIEVRLEAGESVRLIISDTGIGISADALPYVFNRFYQAGPVAYHTLSGTGIGLSLVKELTELMGGHVTVASSTGNNNTPSGTTFTVELPLTHVSADQKVLEDVSSFWEWFPQPDAQSTSAVLSPASSPAEAPLLLIVDDNDELRTYLTNELKSRYRVLSASTGEEGWQLAQAELPDVVVSDVMMPLMDGFELTNLIKTTPVTEHLAVILLTARAAYDNLLTGLRQGADDYLTKPFRIEELLLRIHNVVTRQQRLRNFYSQQLAQTNLPQPLETVQDGWLRTLYKMLETNLDNPELNVDWLSDQLALSRKTLLRKVKALTQLSTNELIRQYRLRKAADLLLAGHSVSETAYMVGFETPAYFGQCFKELYQVTPSEFAHATN